ncbi:hypothetical protein [Pedobacter sp. NJ-S-72]
MNYKDQEVQQVQTNAGNTAKRIEAYMHTIKKLQDQNEELKAKTIDVAAKEKTETYTIIFAILIVIAAGIFFYTRSRKKN